MAASGYKLFVTGDVLTAAQVNDYLMLQTVMVFANSAARTTALSGVLAEGLVSYLKDTDVVEVYTGAAWVSLDDPNAIQNSIVDAKGDLITATADNTPARLAVGNNGETLVADSSTSTGLRWNPTSTMANPVINGGVDIWQRGTSFTGSNTYIYTADRWAWRDSSGGNGSLLQVTSSLPDGFQYGIKLGRASGGTSTSAQILSLPLETSNSIPYANQTITMSFYAKKGANFSPTQLSVSLYSGTGTNQSVGGTTGGAASWTGASAIISQNITAATLTTSWVRYSYSVTVGSTATQLAPYLQITGVGTAGADDYIYLTGVQIDLGSVALPFRRSGGTIQGELAACQRYYEKSFAQATAPANGVSSGPWSEGVMGITAYNTTNTRLNFVNFQVNKRTSTPTLTLYNSSNISTAGYWGYLNSSVAWGDIAQTGQQTGTINDKGFMIAFYKAAGGFTFGQSYIITGNWAVDAEL